jgi:HEAT repeat protein
MKNKIVVVLLFLALPVGILVRVALRRESGRRDSPVAHALEGMKMTLPSPGLETLRGMGTSAVPVLQRSLSSAEAGTRLKASWALWQLGPVGRDAVPELVRCLDDTSPSVQSFSIRALGSIGVFNELVASRLMAKLSSSNAAVSCPAAEVLMGMYSEQKSRGRSSPYGEPLDFAMAFVRSPEPYVRSRAVELLGSLPRDQSTEAALRALASDTNELVGAKAAKWLERKPSRL